MEQDKSAVWWASNTAQIAKHWLTLLRKADFCSHQRCKAFRDEREYALVIRRGHSYKICGLQIMYESYFHKCFETCKLQRTQQSGGKDKMKLKWDSCYGQLTKSRAGRRQLSGMDTNEKRWKPLLKRGAGFDCTAPQGKLTLPKCMLVITTISP